VGWRRALRVGIGAAIFGLVQAVFLARPAWGSGLAIALSAGFFQVEFDHFQIAAWQAWIASQGAWFEILALGEALAAGLALLGGAALGRQVGEAVYQRNRTRQERQGN
jgi:hypothetical protein